MHLVASRTQLQLLFAINGYSLSLSRLRTVLQRKRPGQVNHFLAALFDCLRSEFVAWDGPCFSLTTSGVAVLSVAAQLKQSGDRAIGDYQFVRGSLFYTPAVAAPALQNNLLREPASVTR